jgi:sodium/potassium/calcium exchanger 6
VGIQEEAKDVNLIRPLNLEDDDVFLLDYKQLYGGKFAGRPFLFYAMTCLMIVTMFYMMYVMADKHLTWTLEHLSKFCRMSPDMAGMTFLAFGNGAPDFFTAVFGAARSPGLILGSSVGAGLFVMSVVLGMVILFAAKPKDTFTTVLKKSEAGELSPKPAVLVTPEGTLPNLSSASKRILNQPKVASTPYIRNGLLYGACILFLCLFAFKRAVPLWQPCLLVFLYFGYMSSVVGIHYYQEIQAKKAAKRIRRSFSGPLAGESTETIDNTSMKLREAQAFQELEELPIYHRIPAAIIRTSWTFAERTGVTALDIFILLLKLPVDLVFNLTVPPMESIEDAATCPPHMAAVRLVHRIRAVVSPWGICFLVGSLVLPEAYVFTWQWWIGYAISSAVLSIAMFFTTSNRNDPALFPLHVALAFVTCILWIYAVSSELVSCLGATGELAGISSTIMGIVVLAWGNSFGDLVADVAMARNGHFETAISAVFCGPIQNVLLTIGTSFLIACLKSPSRVLRFPDLDNDIYLALGTLIVVLVLLMIIVPVVGRFRVPTWLGWLLLGIYALYLPMAVLSGLGLLPFMN